MQYCISATHWFAHINLQHCYNSPKQATALKWEYLKPLICLNDSIAKSQSVDNTAPMIMITPSCYHDQLAVVHMCTSSHRLMPPDEGV